MIWIPLLESVAAEHAHFPAVLRSHIITRLLSNDDSPPPADEPEPNPDDTNATIATAGATEKASYDVCLANWATWLIEWRRSAGETDADVTARRQSVSFQLAQALPVTSPNHRHEHEQEETSPKSQSGCVLSRVYNIRPNNYLIYFFWLPRTGRERCSMLCAPRMYSSPEFQTLFWVWIQGMIPRWAAHLPHTSSNRLELILGCGEGD